MAILRIPHDIFVSLTLLEMINADKSLRQAHMHDLPNFGFNRVITSKYESCIIYYS